MTCANFEIALCDYLDGTLTAAGKAEFDEHLAGCAACAELARDAGAAVSFLERVADVEPPPELVTRLFAIAQMPEAKTRVRGGHPGLVPAAFSTRAAAAHGDGIVADDSVFWNDGPLRGRSRKALERGGSRPVARLGGRGRPGTTRMGTLGEVLRESACCVPDSVAATGVARAAGAGYRGCPHGYH